MATKSTCDNCGADNAFRVTAHIATSGGERVKCKVPSFDCDLCVPCFERVANAVKAIFPAKALKD